MMRNWASLRARREDRLRARDLDGALAAADALHASGGEEPADRLQRALILALMGKAQTARSAIAPDVDALMAIDPANLGVVASYSGDALLARAAFRAALAQAPSEPGLLYNLAATLRMTGDFAEAAAICERLIADDPLHVPAAALRSELALHDVRNNNIAALRRLLAQGLSPRDEVSIHFALARECEDVGLHAEAFEHIEAGGGLHRSRIRYAVEDDLRTLGHIRQRHDASALAALKPGFAGARPLFVVGLPRTGTTIVERMLSMNPDVVSIGESNAFALELVALAGGQAGAGSKAGLVDASLSVDMAALGRAYVAATTVAGPARRIIDKMPLNALYLGLIARALPDASLVYLDRDPMDAILAIYKSLFVGAYPYSYDLGELAAYYAAWMRLVAHWRTVLGERLLVVRYETLVAEPEEQARRIMAHCGLAWDARVLRFFENPEPSNTLSAVQVRRPLHRNSIGRWKQHAAVLQPVADWLRSKGIPVA